MNERPVYVQFIRRQRQHAGPLRHTARMGKTRRDAGRFGARQRATQRVDGPFRCGHCRMMVGPVPSGGHNRNHCPFCLYSRHVDADTPGDRASDCGSSMEPVGVFTRPKGEEVIVHRCRGCGFERHNRVAADDSYDAVAALPTVEPRF